MSKKSWSQKFIDDFRKKERSVKANPKANPSYWSGGDSWGPSGSDLNDAAEWVDSQLIKFVESRVREKVK